MGLDQYWLVKPTDEEKTDALLQGKECEDKEIGYHRKFHSLNDYILGELCSDQIEESGNCEDISIGYSELDDLEDWMDENECQEEMADVIENIRSALNAGREVYYHAWW